MPPAPISTDGVREPDRGAGVGPAFAGTRSDPGRPALSQIIAGTYRLRAVARSLPLRQGMYSLSVAPFDPVSSPLSGTVLPVVKIASRAQNGDPGVTILMGSGADPWWLGPEGGTVLVQAPASGGTVMITTYFPPEHDSVPLDIRIERLDPVEGG
jgi:hypothetical protein